MTLCEAGEWIETYYKERENSIKQQIHILSACADDIVSGFAATQNERNKRRPMSETFSQYFKEEKKQLTPKEQERQNVFSWLEFLGKANLLKE